MSTNGSHSSVHSKLTFAGLLIALGIIYGDIGTSPLYVLKAIVGKTDAINVEVVLGGLSCIIWTLTLQTTFKYVFLTLKADNKGDLNLDELELELTARGMTFTDIKNNTKKKIGGSKI